MVHRKRLGGFVWLHLLRILVGCLYVIVAILTFVFVALVVDRFPTIRQSFLGGFPKEPQLALSQAESGSEGDAPSAQDKTKGGLGPGVASGPQGKPEPSSLTVAVPSPQPFDNLGVSQHGSKPRESSPAQAGSSGVAPSSASFEQQSPGGASGYRSVSPPILPFLEKALAALERHDTQSARQILSTASAQAQTDVDKAKIIRWLSLCDVVDEFWRVMGQIVSRLEPLTVISVAETEIVVVETSSQSLTIRAAGQNRTYALREIPAALVKELARRSFGQTPQSKVVLAVYLAVEPKGDRELSRRLLLEAMGAGVDPGEAVLELPAFFDRGMLSVFVDAGKQSLEASLRDSVGMSPATQPASPQPTATLPPGGSSPEAGTSPENRPPASLSEKSRLARQLLEQAKDRELPVDARLAKVDEARQLAEEIGEVELVLASIEIQAQYRRIDRLLETATAIKSIADRFPAREVQREVARAALDLASQAYQARRLQEADALLDIALASARKIGNRAYIQEAQAAKKLIQAARGQ